MSTALELAFLLSGASGLVYEVVWARELAVLVGGTAPATQAVLATFFTGLMLGAFTLGKRAASAADGCRFYSRLELAIALAGIFSGVFLALARSWIAALTDGADGAGTAAVALAVTGGACLPATWLMGATFPALARACHQGRPDAPARSLLGRAYAANTAGAMLGAVAGAFLALPLFGVRGTLATAVAGNLAAAGLAFRAARANPDGRPGCVQAEPATAAAQTPALPWRLASALLLSGFAAISLEIVALRVLAVTLHDTVFSFALAVAAYIGGAAATAAVLGRRPATRALPLQTVLAAAALLAAAWLPTLRLGASLFNAFTGPGAGFVTVIAAEALIALLLAAPAAIPTTWAFLCLAAHPAAGTPAQGAGKATAWNGIGCAVAPILSALVILPAWGSRGLAAVAVLCLALAAFLLLTGLRQPRRAWAVPALLVALAFLPLVLVRGGLYGWVVTPGWHLLWAKEGPTVTVSIEESPTGLRRLRTNNNFTEGGDAAGISQIRQGMLPTLFAPEGASVLALGVGSGIALAGTVAGLPAGQFEAVELIPDIRHAVSAFSRSNDNLHLRPNVHLVVADARTWVAHRARTGHRYGLVVGDLFHAAQSGSGALYAREHFQAVREILESNGVYCQWLALHEAPASEVRTVVRTFFRVFPHGAAVLGSWSMRTAILGLLGSMQPVHVDFRTLAERMAAPDERRRRAIASELDRVAQTAAAFLADAAEMRRWAGEGPDNSDDRPELELRAPLGVTSDLGPDNLMELLPVWRVPDGIVGFADPDQRAQVATVQDALKAFFSGSYAWRQEDLDRAERELRRARSLSAELPFVEVSLRNLAAAWRQAKQPERGLALLRWLDEQRALVQRQPESLPDRSAGAGPAVEK